MYVDKRVLYISNVGDSKAVLFNDSSYRVLTKIHRANNPEEVERVVNSGGKIVNSRVSGML